MQNGKWLSFIIDSKKMQFIIPEEKIQKVLKLLAESLKNNCVNAKEISRIAGHIISMSLAIGSIARLFTRGMYKFIESRDLWYSKVEPDGITTFELEFWLRNLRQNNGFQIKNNQRTTKIAYSDASGTGYGGYIVERLGNRIAQGKFTEFEKSTSSTYCELLAVKYVLQFFGNSLRHEGVQWYSDNVNVSRIIETGSSKVYLQKNCNRYF